ncbi:hypothetical protein D3C72_1194390 [compost metagenome]
MCADTFRVDLWAAVHRHVHGNDAHLAFVVYRNLDHGGRVAHEAVAECQAKAVSLGQCSAPPGTRACRFNDTAKAARVVGIALGRFGIIPRVGHCSRVDLAGRADKVKREFLVIPARALGEFGNEALGRKGMRDVGDRAKPSDAGMRFHFGRLYPYVRNAVRHVDRRHGGLEHLLAFGAFGEERRNGGGGAAVQPGLDLPCLVQDGLQPFDGDGMQVVVMDVVLARPHQFDGCAFGHGLGDDGGFIHEVGLGLAAEPSAQ